MTAIWIAVQKNYTQVETILEEFVNDSENCEQAVYVDDIIDFIHGGMSTPEAFSSSARVVDDYSQNY